MQAFVILAASIVFDTSMVIIYPLLPWQVTPAYKSAAATITKPAAAPSSTRPAAPTKVAMVGVGVGEGAGTKLVVETTTGAGATELE
jgi:hypothetical protein